MRAKPVTKPKTPTRIFKTVYCSSFNCPLIARLREGLINSTKIPRQDALIDAMGNAWCKLCEHRYNLINEGKRHKWEALNCYPYAIGKGQDAWHAVAVMGTDLCIDVALETLLAHEQEV